MSNQFTGIMLMILAAFGFVSFVEWIEEPIRVMGIIILVFVLPVIVFIYGLSLAGNS